MTHVICSIDHHSLLLVRGVDAQKFLQGQVTCDINTLTIDVTDTSTNTDNADTTLKTSISTLGAHCSHKGRMIFNFRALAIDEHTVALNIPSDMMDIATAALKKYIVFSKAELIDASDMYSLIGIEGENAVTTLKNIVNALPTINNEVIHTPQGIVLRLEDHRYELWLTNEQAKHVRSHFTAHPYTDANYWDLVAINAGITHIRPSTTELFTPHAINLQAIDNSVSFKKGCYTGQEVVARMHYLGKPKRYTFLFELPQDYADQCPSVGDTLFSPDKKQSIGDITAVVSYQQQICLLAIVAAEQATQNNIYLDAQFQQKLHLLPLPYAIPKE